MILDDKRLHRIEVAQETVRILEEGQYAAPNGKMVDLGPALQNAISNAKYLWHSMMTETHAKVADLPKRNTIQFSVANETTLTAARRMRENGPLLALNFASENHGGTNFLKGSQNQESAILRGTGLYAVLAAAAHFHPPSSFSSVLQDNDQLIFAPDVPVFRNPLDVLIEEPWTLSLISSAADYGRSMPNYLFWTNQAYSREVFSHRMQNVLAVAALEGYDRLILGPWGCRTTGYSPTKIAQLFYQHLKKNPIFEGLFSQVHFAVFDQTTNRRYYRPFKGVFS
jgi:uncharacterized protein (TIGR02452 family)